MTTDDFTAQFLSAIDGTDEAPGGGDEPPATPARASARTPARPAEIDELMQDPKNLYSNPHTLDWTTTPIAAMRNTIEYAEEAVRLVPSMVDAAVEKGLVNAAKLNEESLSKFLVATRTAFYSATVSQKWSRRGIIVELDDRISSLQSVANHMDIHLDRQHQHNETLSQFVQIMTEKTASIEQIICSRESAVSQRENNILQREAQFKKKMDDYNKRGFWGHVGTAFISLSKSQIGAGFGIVVAISLLVLAAKGVTSLLQH